MRVTTSKILLLLATMLAMVSCEHWNVRIDTEINRDGSCTRRIWTDIDTSLVMDDSWEMTSFKFANDSVKSLLASGVDDWKSDINLDDDSTTVYVISRRFDNVGDMTSNPVYRLFDRPVTSKAGLEKKFKWFYTDYLFTETFDGWEDEYPISLEAYLDDDEASYMFTGYPEISAGGMTGLEMADYLTYLQERFEQWENALLWDARLKLIEEYYDCYENPAVDYETLVSKHHKLINCANRHNVYFLEDDSEELEDGMKKVFNEVFGSDEAYRTFFEDDNLDWRISKDMNDRWDEMAAKMGALLTFDGSYTLKMPGKVTDAGRGVIEDGIIKYRFKGSFLIPGDYTFTASSRSVNVWAFLLTGLILIIAVGSFFIKR